MQSVTAHHGNFLNDKIQITALGEPGRGGAYTEYEIAPLVPVVLDPGTQMKLGVSCRYVPNGNTVILKFQDCDPREMILGLTQESLLAVLIHRQLGFCNGPFQCEENKAVLDLLTDALNMLKRRTKERTERGVEGQAVK